MTTLALGVQWHPEWNSSEYALSRMLFDGFITACQSHIRSNGFDHYRKGNATMSDDGLARKRRLDPQQWVSRRRAAELSGLTHSAISRAGTK